MLEKIIKIDLHFLFQNPAICIANMIKRQSRGRFLKIEAARSGRLRPAP